MRGAWARRIGRGAGDTMVVIGAGPIGLMFMHAAALAGVRVIAVVKRADQVAAAREFGAAEVVRIEETRTRWTRCGR